MRSSPISTAGPQNAVPFGKYLLLKRLAVGGMAELFLARDSTQDRFVVIKRILPHLAEEADFVRMFLDEARIAASLHHPNIIELYELGHLEGSTFIAMEWVDGVDLRRMLLAEQESGGAMPYGIAAWLVARLCEGLQHAHEARDAQGKPLGIVHRDVSPQNVMVGFNGAVKLVDFGIAKATSWMDRSKPGVIKGKFLYLAPEQLTMEPLDHRMDLFSLGVMLYELTVGQSPFYRTSTEAVIYAIRMEDPEPPSKVRRGFPIALEKVILKCLTKDRTKRYQSAGEVRAALDAYLQSDNDPGRDDVERYVSSRFGDASERTSVYVPPNAQPKKPAEKPGPPVPEGRRDTGDALEAVVPTTRADRPVMKNPWEAEVTAPMAKVPPLRDLESTAELNQRPPSASAVLANAVEPTAVSEARKVETGAVFRPLMPTLMGESKPELTRAAPITPPQPPPRSTALPSKPPPPIPTGEIPEVFSDVVSVGENTVADTQSDGAPPRARLEDRVDTREDTAPEPPRATRRKPSTTPVKLTRRKGSSDPDDYVATVDQAQFTLLGRLSGSKTLIVIAAIASALMFTLLLIVLWPPKEAPLPPPIEEPVEPSRPLSMRVHVKLGRGVTQASVDGQAVVDGATLDHLPGPAQVRYSCPGKKRGSKPVLKALSATIPSTTSVVELPITCD